MTPRISCRTTGPGGRAHHPQTRHDRGPARVGDTPPGRTRSRLEHPADAANADHRTKLLTHRWTPSRRHALPHPRAVTGDDHSARHSRPRRRTGRVCRQPWPRSTAPLSTSPSLRPCRPYFNGRSPPEAGRPPTAPRSALRFYEDGAWQARVAAHRHHLHPTPVVAVASGSPRADGRSGTSATPTSAASALPPCEPPAPAPPSNASSTSPPSADASHRGHLACRRCVNAALAVREYVTVLGQVTARGDT